MTNPTTLLRTLLIYAICIPVALMLGYVLATPVQRSTFSMVGVVLIVLTTPWLLKYHHPLMLLGWNSTMIIFFLPGAPGVWLPLVAMSLMISIVHRTIDHNYKMISVPSITWPLVLMGAVVLMTAEARGGIKFRSMGGDVYGGKSYILVLAAIAGYFALSYQRIPREKAKLYLALFFLGGMSTIIGDALYFQTKALYWLYYFFPPNMGLYGGGQDIMKGSVARFTGLTAASLVIIYYMLAKYGVRGIFMSQKPLRTMIFGALCVASLLGGFRSKLIILAMVFALQFYLEGMHRTRLLPALLFMMLLIPVMTLPMLSKMPYSIQRTFSFLPVKVKAQIREDADASTEWRLKLWNSVLPQVPQYLLLGKGYTFTPGDFDFSVNNLLGTMQAFSEDQSWAALVGDYHNGPLSVTIPFGIWGDLAFTWFIISSIRLLYRNYKYGDPELEIPNKLLFSLFVVKAISFVFIFGALTIDTVIFVGYVGLSVSLNGGMCGPAPETATKPETGRTMNALQPAFRPQFEGSRLRR
jgi:hypothetical protein